MAESTYRQLTRNTIAGLAALGVAIGGLVLSSPSASASTSANLLLNGSAETSQCSPGGWEETTMPGWRISFGDPVIDCYGMPNGPTAGTPGSPTRGIAYFQGGSRGNSRMTQTVDVSSAGTAIDAGSVSSTLSGWLGGINTYDDAATVTATYLNASGASLGTSVIGPALAADRGNTTGMVQKAATGAVPSGTRSITVAVDFTMTGTQNDGIADDLALTLNTAVTPAALTVPVSTVPGFDHVFVVMMENNNFSAGSNTADGGAGIIGNSAAPYLNNTLVPMGSLFTNYYAGTHNSDPNYEQIAFGNSYGRSNQAPGGGNANCITDPACIATNNGLGDNLDAIGKSWKQYTQTQTSNCQTTDSGWYSSDDVPFYYAAKMKSDNAYCQAHWQPLPQLLNTDLASTATTPALAWFDADSCNDMEGCGVASGDTWLSQTLPTLFNSPAWTKQKSLLILTTDEDGAGGPGGWGPGQTNQVMTLAIGSKGTVKAGYQDTNRYDHYSSARVIEGALGLTATMTNNDKWATPFNEVFTNSTGGNGPIVSGSSYTVQRSGQAMDDPGGSTTAGTQLVLWAHNAGSNQNWTFTANGDGTYQIRNGGSGQCVDDSGASNAAGSPIVQWPCSGATNQRWSVTPSGFGYVLVSKQSGLVVTASGLGNGSTLTQQANTGAALQTWSLTKSG